MTLRFQARCPLVCALATTLLIAAMQLAWVSVERAADPSAAPAAVPAASGRLDAHGGEGEPALPVGSEIDDGLPGSPIITR